MLTTSLAAQRANEGQGGHVAQIQHLDQAHGRRAGPRPEHVCGWECGGGECRPRCVRTTSLCPAGEGPSFPACVRFLRPVLLLPWSNCTCRVALSDSLDPGDSIQLCLINPPLVAENARRRQPAAGRFYDPPHRRHAGRHPRRALPRAPAGAVQGG